MAKRREPVPEILKIAKEGSEEDLLARLAQAVPTDTTPRALMATFFCAAGRGLLEAVTELLQRGVDPGASNGHVSGLGMASKYAHAKVVELLLARGATVDVRTDRQETPLLLACQHLLERTQSLAHAAQRAAVAVAVHDCGKVVTALLDAGADPNATDCLGNTALLVISQGRQAAFQDDLTIPRALIAHGDNLQTVGAGGQTVLHEAASVGNLPLAQLLLEHGHPVDVGGGRTYTPLMLAVRWGHQAMVETLLAHRAHPQGPDQQGTTPLSIACEENRLELAQMLIAAGADWESPTPRGTMREIAARHQSQAVVEYLDTLARGEKNARAVPPFPIAHDRPVPVTETASSDGPGGGRLSRTFDVTFHVISREELERFFFDVVRNPALAEQRAAMLTEDPTHRNGIVQLYRQFPLWLADEKMAFGESFAFGAAILAGYLHPYWYARGQALSFLAQGQVPEVQALLTPLSRLAMDVFATKAASDPGVLETNDSGGGIVLPERLAELERLLGGRPDNDHDPSDARYGGVFDREGWEAFQRALGYARSHDLALLEASDVVEPLGNECYSDLRNLRAHFLENLDLP